MTKMAKKTVKITLDLEGSQPISQSKIAEANERVREVMKDVIRDFEKKEVQSLQKAALLVLNS